MDFTGMITFAFLCILGLFDVWCVASGGEKKSVSQFVTNCSKRPLIAFVIGLLTCHWFGWMMVPEESPTESPTESQQPSQHQGSDTSLE